MTLLRQIRNCRICIGQNDRSRISESLICFGFIVLCRFATNFGVSRRRVVAKVAKCIGLLADALSGARVLSQFDVLRTRFASVRFYRRATSPPRASEIEIRDGDGTSYAPTIFPE